ncbi:MAG TPA: hypothetical protein VFB12_10535 [Ktedonobacteraceae bacterium]|nr:hypothetical protein [Ktedonobacteraceae bacterium]
MTVKARTLLLHWQEGYEHVWAVLTDLAPEVANVAWYGVRSWVECDFKDAHRGVALAGTMRKCRMQGGSNGCG